MRQRALVDHDRRRGALQRRGDGHRLVESRHHIPGVDHVAPRPARRTPPRCRSPPGRAGRQAHAGRPAPARRGPGSLTVTAKGRPALRLEEHAALRRPRECGPGAAMRARRYPRTTTVLTSRKSRARERVGRPAGDHTGIDPGPAQRGQWLRAQADACWPPSGAARGRAPGARERWSGASRRSRRRAGGQVDVERLQRCRRRGRGGAARYAAVTP